MAEWTLSAHNTGAATNECLRRVTLWSSADREASTDNYYTVSVGISTSDGKFDEVGAYDGATDALKGNEVRDLTGAGAETIDRRLRAGDSLIIRVASYGTPALTASGLTVEWHLELVGGNSQGERPAFAVAGYIPDQRVRGAVDGLTRQLVTSGVAAWTIAVPLQDPVEASAVSDAVRHVFHGRLQVDSTTQISLQRYSGDICMVNGEAVEIGSSGITLTTSAEVIGSTGLETGSGPGTSTHYYVYLSNSQATEAQSSLRLSTTAPTTTSQGKYLAASGNGLEWRHVGGTWLNASTQWVDSTSFRQLVNAFNKRPLPILLTPGYADANSQTTYTTASTTWTPANAGTGSAGGYVANGEDAVEIYASAFEVNSGADTVHFGIGDNSTTSAAREAVSYATIITHPSCMLISTPAAGYRTVNCLVRVSGGTGTYYADYQRGGASADIPDTYLQAWVMG